MKKWLMLLVLAKLVGAEGPWRHYNLDVSLSVPKGWKIIQGPVMLSLDPKQKMEAERRPSFSLTWQQTPPTLDEFKTQVVAAVKQKRGSLIFAKPLQVSGYPALQVRALMPEGPYQVSADLILIRVDKFAGYQITLESFTQDSKVASPIFSQILSSLKVGPRPRKTKLPVVNE